MAITPLARTAMDEKSGRWQNNYMKDLRRTFYGLTPWDKEGSTVRSAYRGKVKSGTLAVVLDDPSLKNHPTFRGAKVVK